MKANYLRIIWSIDKVPRGPVASSRAICAIETVDARWQDPADIPVIIVNVDIHRYRLTLLFVMIPSLLLVIFTVLAVRLVSLQAEDNTNAIRLSSFIRFTWPISSGSRSIAVSKRQYAVKSFGIRRILSCVERVGRFVGYLPLNRAT